MTTPTPSRIQALGHLTIHRSGESPDVLTGSSQRLLALLIVAKDHGVSLAEIAQLTWGRDRPGWWLPALQVGMSNLRRRLPDGWDIETGNDERCYLNIADGWIDVWRLEQVAKEGSAVAGDLDWILAGEPFEGMALRSKLATIALRLRSLQDDVVQEIDRKRTRRHLVALPSKPDAPNSIAAPFLSVDTAAAFLRLQSASLAMLVCSNHVERAHLVNQLRDDDEQHTHIVTGSDPLDLPLVAFATSFPDLRETLLGLSARNERAMAGLAWRLVVEHLQKKTISVPQRVVVVDAHLLDATSTMLTAMLIQYTAPEPFRLIIAGDAGNLAPRWRQLINDAHRGGADAIALRPISERPTDQQSPAHPDRTDGHPPHRQAACA